MECLPDEILINIFLHLEPTRRLKLETVSPRWARIMPYGDLKYIDAVHTLVPESRVSKTDTLPTGGLLDSLILRAGGTLTKISFGQQMVLVTATTVKMIAECCPNVTYLDLSHCKVTENIVQALMLFSDRLKVLNLGNTAFSITNEDQHADNMKVLLSSLTYLEEINLKATHMSNLWALPYLSDRVTSVNLNNCNPIPKDVLLDFLSGGRNLKEVRLSAYSFSRGGQIDAGSAAFEVLCSLESLRVLELSRMGMFQGNDPYTLNMQLIGMLTNLEELYVQYNSVFSSDALRSVVKNCSKLTVLNVANCNLLDEYRPIALLSHLKSLTVASTNAFTDEVLQMIVVSGVELHHLSAVSCPVTDEGILALVEHGHALRSIDISDTEVTDESMTELLGKCPKLERISAQRTKASQSFMAALGNWVQRLRNRSRSLAIDICFCTEIRDPGVEVLEGMLSQAESFTGKVVLDVHQTRVTRRTIARIDDPRLKLNF